MVNRRLHGPDVPDRVRALALDIAHRLRPVCANMPDEDMLELSAGFFAGAEGQEGMRAFAEKRPPSWVGD